MVTYVDDTALAVDDLPLPRGRVQRQRQLGLLEHRAGGRTRCAGRTDEPG